MPNSVGNTGGLFAGLPRMARAALMRLGSTNVQFVNWKVGRENLNTLATLFQSGDARVIISDTYPLGDTAKAVADLLGHHAIGKVAITISRGGGGAASAVDRHGGGGMDPSRGATATRLRTSSHLELVADPGIPRLSAPAP
jgi:hypothetical protein